MSHYTSDAEQVEKLRRWWKEYGWATALGIVLAIIIVVGWQVYRRYESHKEQGASLIYTTMMSNSYDKNFTSATNAANALIKDYAGTSYADLANMWLAKYAVTQEHYQQALQYLQKVQAHGAMKSLQQIAAIRRAEIFLQLDKPKMTLAAIAQVYDKAYMGRIDELKGDAYWAMKNLDSARRWYQLSSQAYQKVGLPAPLVAMKLADLPQMAHATNR